MLPIAIIAGGLGTRLRPLTETVPKSLVPVDGLPFIAHQLTLLQSQGAERIVICAGFLGEMIYEYVGNGSRFSLNVKYSYDGAVRLGTAGALKHALPLLGERFLTIYGDSLLICDLRAIEQSFLRSGKQALMTVFRNDGALVPSNVLFQNGVVENYDKQKPSAAMQHVDFGLSAFHREVFDNVASDTPTDLAEIIAELLERDQLAGYEVKNRFYEVGTPEGIAETEQMLKQRRY
jgi:MurNAc alpha-1-phosphate uridylyltransferase